MTTRSPEVGAARTIRWVGDRITFRFRPRAGITGLVVLVLLLITTAAALMLGTYSVSWGELLSVLQGDASSQLRMVVIDWRLPRAVSALAFGAALGLSGAIFQTLTRNALGSPDVIGFNMGAFSGVLLMMLAGGTGFAALAFGALTGGLLTGLLVYLLAFKRGVQGFRLIIVGIAVAAILGSLNSWITVKADIEFAMSAAVWGAGSLNGIEWAQAGPALVVISVLFVGLVFAAAPVLRQLELGDDLAGLQGLSVERAKLVMIALGIACTAVVTAVAGPISFVALVAPQLARRLTGSSSSIDLVGSALMGALLLSASDLAAQHVFPDLAMPTGAVTVCLGGLYLVWLLARETAPPSARARTQ